MPPDCHYVIISLEHVLNQIRTALGVPFLERVLELYAKSEYRGDYPSWKCKYWELYWEAQLPPLPLSSRINNYEITDFSFNSREDDPHWSLLLGSSCSLFQLA